MMLFCNLRSIVLDLTPKGCAAYASWDRGYETTYNLLTFGYTLLSTRILTCLPFSRLIISAAREGLST